MLPFCAFAIEWWLKNQNKFNGASVRTQETSPGSGEFEITEWVVAGVAQPSNTEIIQIIAEYEIHCQNVEAEKALKKQALMDKLGLNADEFKTLAESLK